MGARGNLALLLVLVGAAMADERGRPRPLAWLATKSVEAVDIDEVLEGIDLNALLQRVDLNAALADVDVQALLERVDLDAVLATVDLDAVLADVDVDALLARVDPNALLARVDPNALLDRVTPDRLLDRVDIDRLLDRVDVDRLMARVDIQTVADRAGIADIVAESTGAVAGSVLDVARRTMVGLDTVIEHSAYRLTRRDPTTRPTGPAKLQEEGTVNEEGRAEVTGRYAGPVSRVAAFAIDATITFWAFTLGTAGLAWIGSNLGITLPGIFDAGWAKVVLFWLWCFSYWWIGLALTGRTVGKGVIGLRILQADGDPITSGEAAVRTLVLPISFLTLGIGVLLVLFSPRRLTWHDIAAGTCEVYDWGDRPAELPAPLTAWLARRGADDEVLPSPGHRTDPGGGAA